jgi:hypothetical protein
MKKRKMVFFLFVAFACYALDHTTTTYIPTSGAAISSSGNKANFDSLKAGINQTKDTVNYKVPWANTAKDSTYWRVARFVKIKADSAISGDSLNIRVIRAVKLNLGSDSSLNGYTDTTFYDSLFDGSTYRARGLARVVKIGNIITLYQPGLSGTITTSTPTSISGIPAKFFPSANTISRLVKNNGAWVMGDIAFSAGLMLPEKSVGVYLDAGTGGIDAFYTAWIK